MSPKRQMGLPTSEAEHLCSAFVVIGKNINQFDKSKMAANLKKDEDDGVLIIILWSKLCSLQEHINLTDK